MDIPSRDFMMILVILFDIKVTQILSVQKYARFCTLLEVLNICTCHLRGKTVCLCPALYGVTLDSVSISRELYKGWLVRNWNDSN